MTRPKRRPRIPRVPVTSVMKDTVGIQMHTQFAVLRVTSCRRAFDCLSGIFNMVALTISSDKQRTDDLRVLSGSMRTMQDAQAKVDAEMKLRSDELMSIQNGINIIDSIIGKLDMIKLYESHALINGVDNANT